MLMHQLFFDLTGGCGELFFNNSSFSFNKVRIS